jgi:tetratricopeptide (TPR) repeat protein
VSFEAQMEATPLLPEQLAELLEIALERAPAEIAAAKEATDSAELFNALPSAAIAAVRLGNQAEARDFAEQCLALAPQYRRNWNYGNALHLAHTTLGLLALEEGEVSVAAEQLRLSGTTPGSPQLNSFGPTMQLARALLERGQSAAVLQYLQQCRAFWRMGGTWLDLWEAKVRAGGVPNFAMNLYR